MKHAGDYVNSTTLKSPDDRLRCVPLPYHSRRLHIPHLSKASNPVAVGPSEPLVEFVRRGS